MSRVNYLMLLFKTLILLNLITRGFQIPVQVFYLLENSCPTAFQYQYDDNGILCGLISITCPGTAIIRLDVELSVADPQVPGVYGNIQMINSKDKLKEDCIYQRPILYKVNFPPWSSIPPKVTKVMVNDNIICIGTTSSVNWLPISQTVNLHHMVQFKTKPVHSISSLDETTDFNLPSQDDSERKGGIIEVPSIKNKYNFNPKLPEDMSKVWKYSFYRMYTVRPVIDDSLERAQLVSERNSDTTSPTPPTTPFPLETKDNKLYDNVCGLSMATNSLIVDGGRDEVPRGTYPWIAALFESNATSLNFLCGGSLISNKHVITAAHCVDKIALKLYLHEVDLLVVLGKTNVRRWVPVPGEKIVEVGAYYIHPDYDKITSDADIAVLELRDGVEFSKYIRPVCLWKGDSDLNKIVGKEGTLVGWGKNLYRQYTTSNPKIIELPIVSQEECLKNHHQFQYVTSNRTLCTGSGRGADPCNGDSGSGLLLKVEDRWTLRGVVSMSVSDSDTTKCDLSEYVVFTDASKFLNWLLSFTNKGF